MQPCKVASDAKLRPSREAAVESLLDDLIDTIRRAAVEKTFPLIPAQNVPPPATKAPFDYTYLWQMLLPCGCDRHRLILTLLAHERVVAQHQILRPQILVLYTPHADHAHLSPFHIHVEEAEDVLTLTPIWQLDNQRLLRIVHSVPGGGHRKG